MSPTHPNTERGLSVCERLPTNFHFTMRGDTEIQVSGHIETPDQLDAVVTVLNALRPFLATPAEEQL